MTRADEFSGPAGLPPLGELLTRYLHRQAEAQAAGFVGGETAGEVVPFEAVPVQPIDARIAWTETLTVLAYFVPTADLSSCSVPPDWSDLVVQQEPATALAFCLGNFPQAVRHFNALLQADHLAHRPPAADRPMAAPGLLSWAAQTAQKNLYPQTLLAVGVLRLAKQFDRAEEMVQRQGSKVPAAWRAAWANEEAALAWHRGRTEEAMTLWQAQPASAPALFNRGMAALFTNRFEKARTWLNQAVGQMAEDSSWHHLGKLYLALAEMRG